MDNDPVPTSTCFALRVDEALGETKQLTWPLLAHPSRRALRALLRMRWFVEPGLPHPEERPAGMRLEGWATVGLLSRHSTGGGIRFANLLLCLLCLSSKSKTCAAPSTAWTCCAASTGGGGGRHHRADRAERRGQDDAVQRGLGAGAAGCRLDPLRRPGDAGMPPDAVSRAGLVRTFQVARGFPRLSVFQHLMVYGRDQPGESLWQAIVGTRAAREREAALAERALGDGALPAARPSDRQSGDGAVGRPEEAAGDRPRADGRAQAGAARRADRRRQSDPAERDRRAAARAAQARHHACC